MDTAELHRRTTEAWMHHLDDRARGCVEQPDSVR